MSNFFKFLVNSEKLSSDNIKPFLFNSRSYHQITVDNITQFFNTIKNSDYVNDYPSNLKSYTHNFCFKTADYEKIVNRFKELHSLVTETPQLEEIVNFIISDENHEILNKPDTYMTYVEAIPLAIYNSQFSIKNESGVELVRFSMLSEYQTSKENIVQGKKIEGVKFGKFNIEPFFIGDILFTEKSIDKDIVQVGSSSYINTQGLSVKTRGVNYDQMDKACNLELKFEFEEDLANNSDKYKEFDDFVKESYKLQTKDIKPLTLIFKSIRISNTDNAYIIKYEEKYSLYSKFVDQKFQLVKN